jgi:hypothetical protein
MALDLFEETWRLLTALEESGVKYAVVGAVALAIHGVPRATTDIDLLVPPEELQRALQAARSRGFSIEAFPIRFRDGMELRRVVKIEGEELLTLDLMLVDANLQAAWQSRLRIESERGPAWVVSREALIAMKAAAGRQQDLADIQSLKELDA